MEDSITPILVFAVLAAAGIAALSLLGKLLRFAAAIVVLLAGGYLLLDLESEPGSVADTLSKRWQDPVEATATVRRVAEGVRTQVVQCIEAAANANPNVQRLDAREVDRQYAALLELESACVGEVVHAYARNAPEIARGIAALAQQMQMAVPKDLRDLPYDPDVFEKLSAERP